MGWQWLPHKSFEVGCICISQVLVYGVAVVGTPMTAILSEGEGHMLQGQFHFVNTRIWFLF